MDDFRTGKNSVIGSDFATCENYLGMRDRKKERRGKGKKVVLIHPIVFTKKKKHSITLLESYPQLRYL